VRTLARLMPIISSCTSLNVLYIHVSATYFDMSYSTGSSTCKRCSGGRRR
jgi:hypothetical protein